MSRRVTYYEALGETRKKLFEMLKERAVIRKAMQKWANSHGGDKSGIGMRENGFGFHWTLVRKDEQHPDPQNWRPTKGSKKYWVPRLTSKQGKQLDAEMRALADKMPHVGDMMMLLGVGGLFDGLYINSISVRARGKRLLLEIPGDYKPPKKVQVKRISDLEYDRLVNHKPKKRKAARVR